MALLLLAAGAAHAQPAADFARDMPSAAQVLQRFGGDSDPVQALGRQCAALDMIERGVFRDHRFMTKAVESHPATRAVKQDYAGAFAQLRQRYEAASAPMDDSKRMRWTRMCERGGQGVLTRPVTRDEVWAMFDPRLRAVLDASVERARQVEADRQVAAQRASTQADERKQREAQRAERIAAERRQTRWTLLVVGGALLALGITLMVYGLRGNRRLNAYEFENRTDGGVIGFESYEASLRHARRRMVYGWSVQIGGLVLLAGLGCAVALFTS
jgi:hypothetical protein